MTIGENIFNLRKKCGMSQDELAKKLLVSRQTISLWEKDKTLPTIDNLIRLKEIFNISVDEILALEVEPEAEKEPTEEPFEFYRFNFTKGELKELFNLLKIQTFKGPILSVVLLTFVAIIGTYDSSNNDIAISFIAGLLLITMVSIIKGFRAHSKSYKLNINRLSETTYEYSIFDNYITLVLHRNNEKIREFKYYFTEIEQIQHLDKWLLVVINGQFFIIRKCELKENSLFYSFMYNAPTKAIKSTPSAKLSIASTALFICSIASLLGGILAVNVLSGLNGLDTENMWVFYLFTPISISSIILGFKLKAMGHKYKKNVIAGFIITFLLCVYGSFCFIF